MSDSVNEPESGPDSQITARPVLELDLDYLEDPRNRRRHRESTPLKEFSPDSVDLVKILLLGAPCVGKTSIIQQFVWNEFDDRYVSTDRKHTYYPSVIINERLYELKISDIPVIPYFPVNAYYEWTDYRFYGLRSATAYILVFDLSNIDTFHYVRTLREQIIESRDMSHVPLMIVGNKQDLVQEGVSGEGGVGGRNGFSRSWEEVERQKRKDIASLVTKHWKCSYIECSAKYNWKVMQLFKETMKMIDSTATIQEQSHDFFSPVSNIPDDNEKNRKLNSFRKEPQLTQRLRSAELYGLLRLPHSQQVSHLSQVDPRRPPPRAREDRERRRRSGRRGQRSQGGATQGEHTGCLDPASADAGGDDLWP